MIKHKKLNRFLCLLLAVVVLFAMPLNTQAHAAVAAPWVMYAIITGLAAMGVTFTCAGGVGAMIDAMENKVAEYQTQTGIQLPIIIIEETSIQPPSEPPSGWNQNKGYFFLTYAAATALTAFAEWLLSDGGWAEGEIIDSSLHSYYMWSSTDNENFYYRELALANNWNDDLTYDITREGYIYPFGVDIYWNGITNPVNRFLYTINEVYDTSKWWITGGLSEDGSFARIRNLGYSFADIQGFSFVYTTDNAWINLCAVMSDGTYILCGQARGTAEPYWGADMETVEKSTEIQMPETLEIPTITPSEGILIDTGTTGAETLEELGDLFEAVFTETGTIPQPQPQVITDSATQPVPTPVPTPNPSPEYEDVDGLGLPALGDALMDKFPFCLPQDLGRLLNIFTAERQTPKWEVDLYEPLHGKIPMQGDTTLSIDFAEFEEIGQITRWVSVIGFCLFLLVVTKEFITW